MRRRQSEAELRSRERREREDAAPRLREQVPELATLKLEIHERSHGGMIATTRYVKHVVVAHAPALFVLPCSEASCEDGGHDVTHLILQSLRSAEAEFSGENTCRGMRGSDRCQRILCFEGHATYTKA